METPISPNFPIMNKQPDAVQAVAKFGHAKGRIVTELRKTIVGMDETIARMLIAIPVKNQRFTLNS